MVAGGGMSKVGRGQRRSAGESAADRGNSALDGFEAGTALAPRI